MGRSGWRNSGGAAGVARAMRLPSAAFFLIAGLVAGCADAPSEAGRPLDARGGERHDLHEMPDSGQDSLRAEIEVPLGRVEIGTAEAGALVQTEVTLPPDGPRPRTSTATDNLGGATRARYRLAFGETAADFDDVRSLGRGVAVRLLLGRRAPTDLSLQLGVADADLDLTGVPLARLTVHAGAGRTRLAFREANPVEMRDLTIRAGVRAFETEGLGWARAERLRFEGGVGRFGVDLSGGPARAGATADLTVGVATLAVTLPPGPVRLTVRDAPGLRVTLPEGYVVEGDGRYASPGAGADAFSVRIQTGPGRIHIRVAE